MQMERGIREKKPPYIKPPYIKLLICALCLLIQEEGEFAICKNAVYFIISQQMIRKQNKLNLIKKTKMII